MWQRLLGAYIFNSFLFCQGGCGKGTGMDAHQPDIFPSKKERGIGLKIPNG